MKTTLKIIIALLLVFRGNAQEMRFIRLGNYVVSKDSFPASGSYKYIYHFDTIHKDSHKIAVLNEVLFYKSNSDSFFLSIQKTTPLIILGTNLPIVSEPFAKFSYFDFNGRLIWEKSGELEISDCKISSDGKFVYLGCCKNFEDFSELNIWDYSGNLVKTVAHVKTIYSDQNASTIYYEIPYYSNPERKGILGKINMIEQDGWEKSFDRTVFHLTAVSKNGSMLLVSTPMVIYSYDNQGNELWEKENYRSVAEY